MKPTRLLATLTVALVATLPLVADEFVNQFPVSVLSVKGAATEALRDVTLAYPVDGEMPVLAYDYGPQTVGGYAIFDVKSFKGKNPVIRLSYSTHPDGLHETGDFTRRGCADYLGHFFDNPVLPANVNRFELYTITRTGTYVAPLVQGQERYVRIQLETPGTEVTIGAVEIRNIGVYSLEKPVGSFRCSDERVNRTWDMCAWTCQLASFPNYGAWRVVDGKLLPRKLAKGSPVGLSKTCQYADDGFFGVDFELRTNPHFNSACGIMLRAADEDNGFVVVASQPAFVQIYRRKDGKNELLAQKILDAPIIDGVQHRLEGVAKGNNIAVLFDGTWITGIDVEIGLGGRFGIYTEKEWWPVISDCFVKDAAGVEIFRDDFSAAAADGSLADWDYTRSFKYMADGAKRDRLVWIGDLWWAQRTCFNAFAVDWPYFRESLRLLAFNQNPEGYVWAAPFAETRKRPGSGEYGHFPSDEFSAWFVPITWDFYLHNGDRALAEEFYPAVKKDLGYLMSRCREDGIFVQRIETSSHACSMDPKDPRTRFYMQMVLWMAYRDGAKLARALGHNDDAEIWETRMAQLGDSVRKAYWREDKGYFTDALEYESEWFLNVSWKLGLGAEFFTREEAEILSKKIDLKGVDKFHLAGLRGMFAYGYDEEAFKMLENGAWFALSDPSFAGAHTCSECGFVNGGGTWDESHPDTAVSGQITNYLLGVEPVEPGFATWRFAPHIVSGLDFAEGEIPTPHGMISARWERRDGGIVATITVPEGTKAVLANGDALAAGRHEVTL